MTNQHRRHVGFALTACLVLLLAGAMPARAVPAVQVTGGITLGKDEMGQPVLEPLLFTWTSPVSISGGGWQAGESVDIVIYGPLTSLGVAPTDRAIGTLVADGNGDLVGEVTIPYDNGVVGPGVDIPRPGYYEVDAVGTFSGTVAAAEYINICPATTLDPDDYIGIDWSHERGTRDGVLGEYSPERTDPILFSVWDERPVQCYATVAPTNESGGNQPSLIAYHDYPTNHYAHDINHMLVPDPDFRWLLGTANYEGEPEGRETRRMEMEIEYQNDGSSASYDRGVIGFPGYVMATPGDRVYVVGRWILDAGHPDRGDRSEIHPPRLLATIRQRDTAAPLEPDSACMTRARQVDIYVSGHGGGANRFPEGLSAALDNGGLGGARLQDVLTLNDQDVYYRPGPLSTTQKIEYVTVAGLVCTATVVLPPILCAAITAGILDGTYSDAGPSYFGWYPAPNEERPINDMDYDFDVPLPDPPGGATAPQVQVITHPQHSTGVNEVITYFDPSPSTGLPRQAHIHLPYYGADNGIYARTLLFGWDKFSPPGKHFLITFDNIYVKDDSDPFPLTDGEWHLWTNVCNHWIYLTNTNRDAFLDIEEGEATAPEKPVSFDVYLDPDDTVYVFTEGWDQDALEGLLGNSFDKGAYEVGVDILGTFLDLTEAGDNDDLAGAVFNQLSFPKEALLRDWDIPSAKVDGTSYFNMRFHVTYIGDPPRIEVSDVPAYFGDVPLGSTRVHDIRIFNLGEQDLEVSSIVVTGDGFSRLPTPNLPLTVAAGEHVVISLQFSPTDLAQGLGQVEINSNDPCNPKVTFDLYATVTYPVISVLPADTTFPPTVVGSSRTQAVTVFNEGSADLIVSSAAIAGTGFSLSRPALPIRLAPNSSTVFTVTFAPPSVARRFDGTLTLVSNDPNHPSVAVTFCGEGVSTGVRLVVLQADGTPYATVDRISLSSYGVKPSTSLRLKDVPLTSILPPTSCEPIAYHLETALPSTASAGGRGSYYNIRVQVGKTIQSVSFTLDTYEFKQLVVALQ
jgi:hypothetical protein